MDKTASIMPVVDNSGPIRIGIKKEHSFSTSLSTLLKGEVITYEEQKIINLKIVLQNNSYHYKSISNCDIDELWKEKIDKLRKEDDQFLFLDNQINEDGSLKKFSPVFFCNRKDIFFSPLCPLCGSELNIFKDDSALIKNNKRSYSKTSERYLACGNCSSKKGGSDFYTFDKVYDLILKMHNLSCDYVEQWSIVPENELSIRKFLKEYVNGIGDHLAGLIVERFGKDAMRALKDNPDALSDFKGIGSLRLNNIKESLKSAFKRKVRVPGRSIKKIKEIFPCYECENNKDCYKSLESVSESVNPLAFYPFSMIVYKDDMINGDTYLENLKEQNSMNSLLKKCSFLKSVYSMLKNSSVSELEPTGFLKKIEVKRTKSAPFVFFPGILLKSEKEIDIKFFVSLWFLTFLYNENNQHKCRSLLALIEEYSQDRESIVKNHMIDLATPVDLKSSINIWEYIVKTGLDHLNSETLKLEEILSSLDTIERRINRMIAEVNDKSFKVVEEEDKRKEIEGMKDSFLKIEEVYIKSLEAIIRDIVKEFNPDNGLNGYGVSGFLKMLRNRDELNEKFRKFRNWYESGMYIERFMGEVQRNFDSIEE